MAHIHLTAESPAWLRAGYHPLSNLWGYKKSDFKPFFLTYMVLQFLFPFFFNIYNRCFPASHQPPIQYRNSSTFLPLISLLKYSSYCTYFSPHLFLIAVSYL
ncbi:hypothetical protein XENOCAPTIV_025243 [Xenoophorus captivus]|uniref:Cytochrome b n=1 Tax=Xenoophorus captivus TaxID=1517983 RepID=A0ABV0RDQ5_9TELE